MKPLDIAIVGAGIGGLAAACLLSADGHRITLIERFDRPRPLGSGLVVQPVGLAVLDAAGTGPQARSLGQPITRMLGHSGKRVALDVQYRPTAPGLAMHRAALFHVLWERVQQCGVTLQTGAAATAAPLSGTKRIVLRGDHPALGPFDLTINAAGAGSALSPLVARPLGYGAVWGQVPWPANTNLPTNQLRQRYYRASHMAGILPIGRLPGDPHPRAAIFWSLPSAMLDSWHRTNLDQWRQQVTAFWPAMAPFVAALGSVSDMTPARYGHGTLRHPVETALAHIGDAAHRASPQLGQGANMALLDAMALTLALRSGPPDTALPAYARTRRWHMRTYQMLSAAFTPMYQSGGWLLPGLRDHALAPMSGLPGLRQVLTAVVSGDVLPPLASTHW